MSFTPTSPKLAVAIASLLVAISASSCAALGQDHGDTIRYQTYSGSVDLSELADALGYLEDVDIERVGDVQGGPESLRSVATKQVEYGAAFNGAIAKLRSTGAPLTSVITYYGSSGDVSASLTVLKESGITEARDLIGKKVAVNTLGANAEAILDTYLEKGGLSQDEIEEVTLVPTPGINAEAALREGQVDAAYLSGALWEVARDHGGLRTLTTDVDLVGPYSAGSYVLRDEFIEEYPETVEKWVSGLARAIEWARNHDIEQVRKVMRNYLTEHDRADEAQNLDLWEGTGIPSQGGLIEDRDYALWLDWLEKSGEVDEGAIDPSEIYTNEFNPYAEEN